MLVLGVVLGLVLGLAVGGRLENLATVRLRALGLLFAAVVVRFATEAALGRGVPEAVALRLPLLAIGYGGLLVALWANRRLPGIPVAFVGIGLNAIAIGVNGGAMPVWEPSLTAAGFAPVDLDAFHVLLPATLDATFVLRAGPIGDVIPFPLPVLANVLSIGDVVLSLGLASFLFATIARPVVEAADAADRPEALDGIAVAALDGVQLDRVPRVRPATGFAAALLRAAVAVDRPAVLGGTGLGLATPGTSGRTGTSEMAVRGGAASWIRPASRPGAGAAAPDLALAPTVGERVRSHPYVRLALDGRFSALWLGQLVSLFGDRVHQVALAFLVLGLTGSPLAVGLVFVAATLPNLLLGPVAGTFVDRWDHRTILIASDLLRAIVVVLIPIAATVDVLLVYPLVFLLTAISIFFRPARMAILPRLVREDDLLTANSSMWVGETLADVLGYPIAGLLVAFVGTAALPLAFWLDGATYLVSAFLLGTIALPALARSRPPAPTAGDGPLGAFRRELGDGFGFLRREIVLLVNTAQGVAGQLANGALVALTPVYAERVLVRGGVDPAAAYALLETGLGIGSLVGGFAVGLLGSRARKGLLVTAGYVGWGLAMSALALTDSLPLAIALMAVLGAANMVYLIPSQTLFQERTPAELIGRVVGSRFSLVFGATTLSMAAGGALGGSIGIAPVIGILGLVAVVGGLLGLLVPAVRRA